MIDHIGFAVTDYQKGKDFYAKALAPLGYSVVADMAEYKVAGFGANGVTDFWVAEDTAARGTHIAFKAESKEAVDAFHSAAIEAGATDNGAPGYREMYSPSYYGAFVHDPDGHNIEVVWHDPNKS